jgi:hypothetical protein
VYLQFGLASKLRCIYVVLLAGAISLELLRIRATVTPVAHGYRIVKAGDWRLSGSTGFVFAVPRDQRALSKKSSADIVCRMSLATMLLADVASLMALFTDRIEAFLVGVRHVLCDVCSNALTLLTDSQFVTLACRSYSLSCGGSDDRDSVEIVCVYV